MHLIGQPELFEGDGYLVAVGRGGGVQLDHGNLRSDAHSLGSCQGRVKRDGRMD